MIKPLPTPTLLDPEIEIRLALSAWQPIFEQLTHGSCEEFGAILAAIATQSAPQTEAANRALLEQAAETQKTAELPQPVPTLN